MKIKCIVIDDEPVALEKMQRYVKQTSYLELVAACESPIVAMEVLSEHEVDAIFTDINMLEINGLDLVSSLDKCPLVVFVTAYTQYAVDSYKFGAVDYIMKPYGYTEFQRAAERVKIQYERMCQENVGKKNECIFVRTDGKWMQIRTADIRYVKGLGDYLHIQLVGNVKPVITYATFANMLRMLTSNFIQVHRSWIVNVDHIKAIERNRVVMDKDIYIPISDSFKKSILDYLQIRSIGKSGRTKDDE